MFGAYKKSSVKGAFLVWIIMKIRPQLNRTALQERIATTVPVGCYFGQPSDGFFLDRGLPVLLICARWFGDQSAVENTGTAVYLTARLVGNFLPEPLGYACTI